MTRAGRIVSVTIGLMGAGLVCGAVAGGTSFTMVSILAGQGMSLELFEVGAIFGAPLGTISAPLLSWLLLRRVPLGRVFLLCSVGTAIGGVVGWFSTTTGDIVLNSLASAFIGCVIAAIALHYRVQRA